MAKRSSVLRLPATLRAALDQKLIAEGFMDYIGLAAWLTAQGHPVTKSAVHRYGKSLELKMKWWPAPVSAHGADVIDERVRLNLEQMSHQKIRESTGVLVLVIDPPTRETHVYATHHSVSAAQEIIVSALFAGRGKT